MKCPDCNSPAFKKHGTFYTCQRCGLSVKPWEIQKAQERAKAELKNLEEKDPLKDEERRKRRLRKYRNWYEGRQE